MAKTPSPGWYRLFQKGALAVGCITLLVGIAFQNSATWGAGAVILIHALVATLIIAIEDRRTISAKTQCEPQE